MAFVIVGDVFEDCDATQLAYVVTHRNVPVTQADIGSITYTVTDLSTSLAVPGHDNVSLNKSAVIFDALQTAAEDAAWDRDDRGYNFRHDLPGTAFPNGDREYSYECIIVRTNGGKLLVKGRHPARRLDRT